MMAESEDLKKLIEDALIEDIGEGDVTTFFCVSAQKESKSSVLAKEDCVLCGMKVARQVMQTIDNSIRFRNFKKDGEKVFKGEKIAEVRGKAVNILKGERLSLNFLALLSGIATYTSEFVERVRGTGVKIMDTRKTTPTLRFLEKYAVRAGGGISHRKGLWDAILIKDNHLRCAEVIRNGKFNEESLKKIIKAIRESTPMKVEVEVETLQEFKKVIFCCPDIILLDNFNPALIKKTVIFRDTHYPEVKLEASGGINLKNVKKVAQTGVEFISVGSLTHSPSSIDFSLNIDE